MNGHVWPGLGRGCVVGILVRISGLACRCGARERGGQRWLCAAAGINRCCFQSAHAIGGVARSASSSYRTRRLSRPEARSRLPSKGLCHSAAAAAPATQPWTTRACPPTWKPPGLARDLYQAPGYFPLPDDAPVPAYSGQSRTRRLGLIRLSAAETARLARLVGDWAAGPLTRAARCSDCTGQPGAGGTRPPPGGITTPTAWPWRPFDARRPKG